MTAQTESNVMRRKMRPVLADSSVASDVAEQMTPARALRTTFARAAVSAADLDLSVLAVAMDDLGLDDLLDRIGTGMALLSLETGAGPVGIAAANAEFCAVLIEMQTTGKLAPTKATTDRPLTRTDTAMVVPLLGRFLAELPAACVGSLLDGWVDGIGIGAFWESPRVAALALEDQCYRLVRLTLDFGVPDRAGDFLLALPVSPAFVPAADPPPDQNQRWSDLLQGAVLGAPAQLDAVLHRMKLPFSAIEQFDVGTVLELPGVTVSSVRVEGPGRAAVAAARLGQMAGLRAIRIEQEGPKTMQDSRLGAGTVREPAAMPAPFANPMAAMGHDPLPDAGTDLPPDPFAAPMAVAFNMLDMDIPDGPGDDDVALGQL